MDIANISILFIALCVIRATAIVVEPLSTDDSFTYIDNGVVKLGIDMGRGGAIGYFSASGSKTNIVNCHDMGREIQLSFYAGPNFYNPDGKCDKLFRGQEWYVQLALQPLANILTQQPSGLGTLLALAT